MKWNISLGKTKSVVVLTMIFMILSACSSKSPSTLTQTKLLSTQAINEQAAQLLTASSEDIEKTKTKIAKRFFFCSTDVKLY